jgi:hypothetical protein
MDPSRHIDARISDYTPTGNNSHISNLRVHASKNAVTNVIDISSNLQVEASMKQQEDIYSILAMLRGTIANH